MSLVHAFLFRLISKPECFGALKKMTIILYVKGFLDNKKSQPIG